MFETSPRYEPTTTPRIRTVRAQSLGCAQQLPLLGFYPTKPEKGEVSNSNAHVVSLDFSLINFILLYYLTSADLPASQYSCLSQWCVGGDFPRGRIPGWYPAYDCDFELKNGSGFWGRGFIAGASYGGLEIKKALMNFGVFV